VVDDAIIVGERVHTEFEKGNLGLAGATKGAFAVSRPVIFGVVTTIIAFLPWIFLSGTTQEFTRQISWVVMLALAFSLIEALLILPAHLASIKEAKDHSNARGLFKLQNNISQGIVDFGNTRYAPWLKNSVAKPGLTLVIFISIFIVVIFGLMGQGYVKSSFSPEIESEQVVVDIELRDGTTYERALEILANVQSAQEELIQQVEEEAIDGKTQVVENWYTRSRKDSVIAILRMAPPEVRSISPKEAASRLRELIGDLAEAKQVSVNYTFDDDGPDLDISVRHPDLQTLQVAVAELRDRVRQFSALYDVTDSLESASEELRFELRPGVEKLGLTLGSVMQQVRQAYYGEEVQRLPREGQDVRVMLRYPLDTRESIESLKNFRIRMDDGREVPLTSVVDVSYAPGLKEIDHWDGLRSARVTGYLKEPVLKDIKKELEDNFYPNWLAKYPGLSRANIGQSAAEQKFMAELIPLILMALFAMYCMLAIAFKSYSQPAAILIAIPFATVGAVIGHLLHGMPFSIYSYFGTIAASGVVINDNLVLIDAYNARRREGQSIAEATQTAARARFRPILITSVTTFIGLVPLMLEQSSQAAWLKPIVVSLSYGLLVAFFVTLFLVPALLILGDRYSQWRKNLMLRLRARTGNQKIQSLRS
ncbi:MAG: efflux RND transporter permease subunit, partial [Pseudomonadota bacterium]